MPIDHVDRVVQQWKAEKPDYDLAPVEIIGRAGRIMEHVDRALEAKFEEFQISRASFDVLAALRRSGKPYKLTQRDLMRSLFRTSGSMSLRIDSLQKQGLVVRSPDKEDRRSVFVTLTPKGIELLETVIPEHLENESSLVAGLNRSAAHLSLQVGRSLWTIIRIRFQIRRFDCSFVLTVPMQTSWKLDCSEGMVCARPLLADGAQAPGRGQHYPLASLRMRSFPFAVLQD